MKISTIIVTVAFVIAGITTSCTTDLQKPNIIFIIGDDISWDDIGCYGNSDVFTPNIDKLASEGMLFNNVYLTASSCSPSRTSIISGRYSHNTRAAELHTDLPEHLTFFPEELREAGYYTGVSGKWHMGDFPKRAFDTLVISGDIGPGGEKQWVNLLKERAPNKPFFFWFAAFDAHRGWSADTCANPHDPSILEVPVGLADMEGTRQDLASYYNEIQRFDKYVGEVHDELEMQGVAENTLIIVMADNGRPFPRSKTRVYDSGMKTPFIAWWPKGIKNSGSVSDALISVIDLAPTFTDMAGLESDDFYQGRSFAMLFEEPGQEFREYVFSEHNWHDYEAYERMVRTKDFLYLYNGRPEFANQGPADAVSSPSMADLRALKQGTLSADQLDVFMAPRPVEELFDCRIDPEQIHNIAGEIANMEVLEQLRAVLKQWQDETSDTQPENLTKDWYVRDADTYISTEQHGIRGEMPGMEKGADTITFSGPF